jgi:hypothetical protein
VVGNGLRRVVGIDLATWHEHGDHVARGTVQEALADDAQAEASDF